MRLMDSLDDLLRRKNLNEPPEVAAIKDYARDKFDSDVAVRLSNEQIIITADSSALASALRSNWPELVAAAKTNKKLILRIG